MKTTVIEAAVLMILVAVFAYPTVAKTQEPKEKLATIRPVPFTAVHLDDVFWAPRIETNRTVTIPYKTSKPIPLSERR